MIVFALDTCLDACSVAVLDGAAPRAVISEPMRRGHQERLASMAAEAMAAAGINWARVDRIGVTVGPGSFTGLRVGLAFAKGLGLALERPVAGIGALEALAAEEPGFVVAAVDARREQAYLQIFESGRPLMAPDVLTLETAAARVAELWTGGPATLVGPGAALFVDVLPGARVLERPAPDPLAIARLAAAAPAPVPPPRPLYLRAPDVRPAGS